MALTLFLVAVSPIEPENHRRVIGDVCANVHTNVNKLIVPRPLG